MKNLIALFVGLACLACFVQAISFRELSSPQHDEDVGVCIMQSFGRNMQPLCKEGSQVDDSCYSLCPEGYHPGDDNNTPSSDEEGPGPAIYCWSGCPSDYSDSWDTCMKPTAYGQIINRDTAVFGNPSNVDTQSECEQGGQTCEFCNGVWVPVSNCGSCVAFCPVTCPEGFKQLDNETCGKHRMRRSLLGKISSCPADYMEDYSSDNGVNYYSNAPADYDCVSSLCLGGCPKGWETCGSTLCMKKGTKCTSDMSDHSSRLYGDLHDLASKITDPSQGDSVTFANIADESDKENLKYPMCP